MTIRDQLTEAISTLRGVQAADSLCEACVGIFAVDAAAISVIFDGANTGTLGASDDDARVYDELQFTLGEGPCLDTVRTRAPVMVTDFADRAEIRWPAYTGAMLGHEIRSVYAMPVVLAGEYVGALDFYRHRPGPFAPDQLGNALVAAELSAIPMLDLFIKDQGSTVGEFDGTAWDELATLTRSEVSQATGMLIAQLNVDPAEALVRLRAHAYATHRSASDVARDILDGKLRLEKDQ